MPTLDSDGVAIHYEVFGEGKPIVLVHGFAANLELNWVRSGWVDTLTPLRQVVALDCRGHGKSGKPLNPLEYIGNKMSDDVVRVMDELSIEQADLFGYSMGGRISMQLLVGFPQRFTSCVLGGVGGGMTGRARNTAIASGMRADDASTVENPIAKGFRLFAERTGADLGALAAVREGDRRRTDKDALAKLDLPVLIVNGEEDALVGSPDGLAAAIPGAKLLKIPDRNHLTVVPDPRFKAAVVEFLKALD